MTYYLTKSVAADEIQKLDRLFGEALLDDDLRDHLLQGEGDHLMKRYGLSPETRDRLFSVQAPTLHDFASGIYLNASLRKNAAR